MYTRLITPCIFPSRNPQGFSRLDIYFITTQNDISFIMHNRRMAMQDDGRPSDTYQLIVLI